MSIRRIKEESNGTNCDQINLMLEDVLRFTARGLSAVPSSLNTEQLSLLLKSKRSDGIRGTHSAVTAAKRPAGVHCIVLTVGEVTYCSTVAY